MRGNGNLATSKSAFYFYCIAEAISISVPHAILTPLLYSKGMNLPQIGLMQAIYSVVILLAEFPSGVLSDLFGRRRVFIVSKAFLLAFFILVIFSEGFLALTFAWSLYALSSALATGTIDAALINAVKTRGRRNWDPEVEISTLVRRSSQINFAGLIIGSLVGGFLFRLIGESIYLISVAFLCLGLVAVFLFFSFPPEDERDVYAGGGFDFVRHHVLGAIREAWTHRVIRYSILGLLAVQCILQIHFQFWQGYFLDIGIEDRIFPWVYVLFQLVGVLAGFMPANIFLDSRLTKRARLVGLMMLSTVGVLIVSSGYVLIAGYFVFVFFVFWMANAAQATLSANVSMSAIGSVTSLASSAARLGGAATLTAGSSLMLVYEPSVVIPLLLGGLSAVGGLVVVWIWSRT